MKQKRRGVDFWQNTVIALLTVSAVVLFARTELFLLGWEAISGTLFVASQDALSVEESPVSTFTLDAPLHLSVSNREGRYADIALTTASPAFPRLLLARALSAPAETEEERGRTDFEKNRSADFSESRRNDSAEKADSALDFSDFTESRRADFLRALDGTSLYCDFLYPLPLSLLTGLAGAPEIRAQNAPPIRSAALAGEGDAVVLYLWDGGDGYFRRDTAVSIGELEEAAADTGLQDAFFAMDRIALEKGCQNVSPLSLFLEETPVLPVLSVFSGVSDADRLLTVLHFNPRTHSHYTEPNGTEVIMEDGRSLRLRADGSVYYQSGGRAELTVDCAGEIPTDWEAAVGCAALLDAIVYQDSPARLCLTEIVRQEDRTVVRFIWQWNGIPVHFAADKSAAAVILKGNAVASLELLPRRFFSTEETSFLLPRAQALGIAGMEPGPELSIAYVDFGMRAYARWISG